MTKTDLLEHLEFHVWATERMVTACEALSLEALKKPVGGAFGSPFGTLVHMYSAEDIWLSRWQGREDVGFAPEDAFENLEDLSAAWQAVQVQLRNYLKEADTDQVMEVVGHRHPLWQMALHMIDHSSFHRGQIMYFLREAGQVPPPSNFIHYLRDKQ